MDGSAQKDGVSVSNRLKGSPRLTGFSGATVTEVIRDVAESAPDSIALICGEHQVTYRDLEERSSEVATRLQQAGATSETRVGVWASRSVETVVAILGVLKANAAYVPLDPEYPSGLLEFVVNDAGICITLAPNAAAAEPVAYCSTVLPLNSERPAPTPATEFRKPRMGDLAYVLYTSGSTGKPKGVLVTHANLAHSTGARFSFYKSSPKRFLLLSSFAFDSSVAGLFWTLCSGGTLVLPSLGEERDPAALARLITNRQITHTLCLPSFYGFLLKTGVEFTSLKAVIVAGESCPPWLPAEHARRLPDTDLFNEYGPTEGTVWSTACRLTAESPIISIGHPIGEVRIHLLDEARTPVSQGEPGEIYIGGPGVARGYLNQPELTAARFLPDHLSGSPDDRLYKTGDLARTLPDGALEFLGRTDHQVKIRGYRVELGAIEAALQTHPAVRECAISARDDGDSSKRLVAYIVPAEIPAAELREHLTNRVPAYMMPSAFVGLGTLPRMPNGKVDRTALPERKRTRPELAVPFAPARSALERYLVEEWQSILELDTVGVHDTFFELGGDSLLAATLMSRVQQKLGEPIFVVALFEAPTVAKLTSYLHDHYSSAVARVFGGDAPVNARGPQTRITPELIARIRGNFAPSRQRKRNHQRPENARAIFILAPPRSGTTLLRAMLDKHPALRTSSELRLLGFETLTERQKTYQTGGESIWLRSPARLIQAIRACSAEEAVAIFEDAVRRELSSAEFYGELQRQIAPRELVDKSPSYALNLDALQQAEEIFQNAFYIHLSRHPYEMIRSFEQRRMDQIYFPNTEGLTPQEAGELVWLISHSNILEFLKSVPTERQHHVRFHDLVTTPREAAEALCEALGIPFDSALLNPYAGTPGNDNPAHHTSDDPHFFQHRSINAQIAEGWRGVFEDNFLSHHSWELADKLGYQRPGPIRGTGPTTPAPAKINAPKLAHACDEPIAIIGMAGRFPGAADVEAFWANLCAGVESIRPFTQEELQRSGVDPGLLADPTYVNAGAVADGADEFAAAFFGYTPREAELMDPQHRLLLETAWEAFEHAGYDVARLTVPVGVFASVALNSYLQNVLATRPELAPILGQYSLTIGNEKDFVASRIAHKLDLHGPAIGIQTACSSTLVALHLACQSLRAGEIGMALVGGGRVRVPLHSGYFYVDGGIPSPDGHCRAFDARAQGCVPGSGVAAVILKRFSDAQRDGDHSYALIKSSAINNDGGGKVGFTAPSVDGQAKAIQQAHQIAGITSDAIGYVEAHGTGTSLGDPIEINALTRAFRVTSDRIGHCRIGSLKTNIGHLDAGAGVAGLIKTALALDRELIPPSLHFETPNPQIDFANSPFVVNTRLTEWSRGTILRRAGVSSFGIGGTNAHAILEEAPRVESQSPARPWQLIVLSAKTPTALAKASERLSSWLQSHPNVPLADVAYTLQLGRREFQHRRFVVARTAHEAAEALSGHKSSRVVSGIAAEHPPKVAFMFPGQGAQHARMAQELFENEPVFRAALLECAEILKPEIDLAAVLYGDDPDQHSMKATAVAQPAIFAVEYAMAKLWESWGVRPDFMLGHSVGEFAAACIAGVFSLSDAIRLVAARARLMQEQPSGAMLAVRVSESDLHGQLPEGVEIAAINSPRLTIVSGSVEAIEAYAGSLRERGIACTPLNTSHAFHSWMVEPVLQPFTELAGGVALAHPRIPLISTLTGGPGGNFETPEYWAQQLRKPVRFRDAIRHVPNDHLLLEVGPGASLAPLARQSGAAIAISSLSGISTGDQASMLDAVGRLWLAGVQVDWKLLHGNERRTHVSLPTYPFERERYWINPAASHRPAPVVDDAPIPLRREPKEEIPTEENAILKRLRRLLHEMSGVPEDHMAATASFLELGFDSLFLTQLTLALKTAFGVKVGFRQLLDEFSTLESLALRLESAKPSGEPVKSAKAKPAIPARLVEAANHGPFRPLQDARSDRLSERQEASLERLISRYALRTAGSKRYAQEHRSHFADPRAVSGFRRAWKEIVYPIVAKRSSGARLWDIDGSEYVDFTMGFGTNLLGHSPQFITNAVKQQLDLGVEIGPQSPLAGEAAQLLCKLTGMERATFCNTGSEAVIAAVRVARTVTGRNRIATFNGYHGIADEFLVRGKWIGDERRSVPIAPGIPEHIADEVLALDYGEPESLDILRAHANEIAAVLVEPVQSRRPDLQPRKFLHTVREITKDSGSALIFDEMITGFRCHQGGAQAWFNIKADLATYGKILGGGMPVGALCGDARYMDALDGGAWNFGDSSQPETGMTFFAGTYVRHPLAMAGTLAILRYLDEQGPELQEQLNHRTARLVTELKSIVREAGAPVRIESFASMFFVTFTEGFQFGPLFFCHLRDRGIHAWDNRLFFLSTAHTEDDLARLLEAVRDSLRELYEGGFFERVAPSVDACDPVSGDGHSANSAFHVISAQEEILLAVRLTPESSCAFNETSAIQLEGPLDVSRLQRSLNRLISRHEALRTRFDGTLQRVVRSANIEFPVADLSGLPTVLQERTAKERITAEASKRFDLEEDILIRCLLLKISENRHTFVVTVHHVVCDGWSFGVILRELAALYREEALPAATQLRDYAAWSNQQDSDAVERYWLGQFETTPPPLELPSDRPRGIARTFRSGRCDAMLPSSAIETLKQIGADEKTTLFTTLFAAFLILLKRLSGQRDIVVGIPAAGQAALGAESLVGHCVNLLPIRAQIEDEVSFATFLQTLRDIVLDAFEHQNYTLGRLLQKLSVPRDLGRMPLLNVSFNFERATPPLDFSGATGIISSVPKAYHQFELSLDVIEHADGVDVRCTYNRNLYDEETIQRWLGYYGTLLQGITSSKAPLRSLRLLSAEERNLLLVEWNDTTREFPSDKTLPEIFHGIARHAPEKIAIVDDSEQITYGALAQAASEVARKLRTREIAPGALVGLPAVRSIGFVTNVLGILEAGGAYAPIALDEPGIRAEKLRKLCDFSISADGEISGESSGGERRPTTPDDPAYVLFTSGSSGEPKGVIVPHRGITRLVCNPDYVSFSADDIVALASNPCFDAITFELWGALLNGARLVITPAQTLLSPAALQEHLGKHGITTAFLTTSLFNQLAQHSPGMFRNLRSLVFGGEAADPTSVRLVLEHGKPENLVNGYGPTEATTFAVCHRIDQVNGYRVPIGRPISNTQAFILDEHHEPVPIGITGELYIGGPGVALGYLNSPELTSERFIQTPYGRLYRTGDMVRWLPDGTIDCLGRGDQQIKLRGFRIEPGEIEAAMRKIPSLGECAVLVREVAREDRRLIAYFTVLDRPAPSNEELRDRLKDTLPAYMVPSAFVELPRFPLTPNGKLDTASLPLPNHTEERPQISTEPRSALDAQLIEVWEELLNCHPIGIRDNFFSLGGHSLLAAKMLSKVEAKTGKRPTFAALFEDPTIEHLSNVLLRQQQADATEQPFILINPEGTRRPFFFLHGDFVGGGFFCHTLARHLAPDRPFIAVHPHGLVGDQPGSISAMAKERLRIIREIQPNGPYLLGGYCNGAVTAFEIARILKEEGQEVSALILLAADGSGYELRHWELLANVVGRMHGENDEQREQRFLKWRHNARLARALAVHYGSAVRNQLRLPWNGQVRAAKTFTNRIRSRLFNGRSPLPAVSHSNESEINVSEAFQNAMLGFVPHTYPSKATLLWPQEQAISTGDPTYGWADVCESVELIQVPGNHHSCISQSKNLDLVGEEIRRAIAIADPSK